MEIGELKVGAVLKHAVTGYTGQIQSLQGVRMGLMDAEGVETLFHFSPKWEALPAAEAAAFIEGMKKPAARPPALRRVTASDPDAIRKRFEEYMAQLRDSSPKIEKRFREFWVKVLAVIRDLPGQTWDVRESATFGLNIVIKIASKRPNSQGWVQFVHLFGDGTDGTTLDIVAINEHVPPQFEPLFPKRKDFYGTGSTAYISYDELDKVEDAYIQFLAETLSKHRVANA